MDGSPSSNGSDRVSVTSASDKDENSSQARIHESIGKPCPEQSSGWTPMPLDLILSRKDLARDLFYHLNVGNFHIGLTTHFHFVHPTHDIIDARHHLQLAV